MWDRIKAAGATFVTISPQTPEKSRELIAARKLAFPILRDEGNAVAGRFNRVNRLPDDLKRLYLNFGVDLEASNGEASWTLPVPGTYVIDTRGIIRYASADADYTRRPEPEETLAALEAHDGRSMKLGFSGNDKSPRSLSGIGSLEPRINNLRAILGL